MVRCWFSDQIVVDPLRGPFPIANLSPAMANDNSARKRNRQTTARVALSRAIRDKQPSEASRISCNFPEILD